MKKKYVISAALLLLLCASLYAQKDFFELVATGTSARVLEAIREGANATDGDRLGVTPLMAAAARNPDPAVLGLLLAAGAHVAGRDAMEETPLMYAGPTPTRASRSSGHSSRPGRTSTIGTSSATRR